MQQYEAKQACTAFSGHGWGVHTVYRGAVVCNRYVADQGWGSSCDSCDSWRLLVFESGSDHTGSKGGQYNTRPGMYYGGRTECNTGYGTLPYCGTWPGGDLTIL